LTNRKDVKWVIIGTDTNNAQCHRMMDTGKNEFAEDSNNPGDGSQQNIRTVCESEIKDHAR